MQHPHYGGELSWLTGMRSCDAYSTTIRIGWLWHAATGAWWTLWGHFDDRHGAADPALDQLYGARSRFATARMREGRRRRWER